VKIVELNKITILQFDNLSNFHNIRHFVTTRKGGCSNNQYESLNLGFGTEDETGNVLKNRILLSEELGIPLDWFIFPQQTHSNNVVVVGIEKMGNGASKKDNAIPNTDALITNTKNVCIVVQVADCVPILLYDYSKRVVACIHAGWRGTSNKISEVTIRRMQKEFGCEISNIIAAIGPSIGKCCYEVGEEVVTKFKDIGLNETITKSNGGYMLDLKIANYIQLVRAGIINKNIEISGFCSYCNNDFFYSSRRDNRDTGRFVAGIMLI